MGKKPYQKLGLEDLGKNRYPLRDEKTEEFAEDLTAAAFNVPKKDLFPEIGGKVAKNEGERKNEKQNEIGKETESFSERQEMRKEQLELAKKAGNKKMIEYWEGHIQQAEESAKQRAQQKVKDTKKPQEISNNNLENKNMSKEDPTAKSEQQQTIAPEISTTEASKAQSRQQEELERVFIPDTRGHFDRLKDWAKEKVVSLYEKVGTRYEESLLGAVTTEKGGGIFNRIEAAFNDKLMKWHEGKAMGIAQKLDSAKNQFAGFENGRKMMEKSLANLDNARQQGISTVAAEASIKKQMRDFDEKMAKSQADVNKYQSKLESRNNKMSGYTNARDRACKNLTNRYEEKLKPWEKQVESIKKYSGDLEVEITRAESQRDQINQQIDEFKQTYQRFLSRRDMKAALSGLTIQLENWNGQINTMAKEKSVMDGRISRAEDRANVYRDKRDKINGYTVGRPAKPEAGERARTEAHSGREEIKTEEKEKGAIEAALEKEVPQKERDLVGWVQKWNDYLKEKNPNIPQNNLVNTEALAKVVGERTDTHRDFNSFKDSLDKYYKDKYVNMPREHFDKNINNFAKETREQEIEEAK